MIAPIFLNSSAATVCAVIALDIFKLAKSDNQRSLTTKAMFKSSFTHVLEYTALP